tara:strand:- start:3002 stop:3208 length:207 start_codon:yes stop_codon:yes gene_type:complete
MEKAEGFSWRNRRRVIWATLEFCAGVIVFCLTRPEDREIYETAVSMAFTIGGTTVGAYAFGAAWENRK